MFSRNSFLVFFTVFCFCSNLQADIERRAAFDLGSGSLKLLIADVDSVTQKIDRYVFSTTIQVPLSDDLAKNNKEFSEEIQEKVKVAIHELKLLADEYGAKRSFGVATEAFRIAKNGEDLINQLIELENFPLRIISQKEEASLGFATAVAHSKENPENAVVWDIGNGSFQISWKEKNEIALYAKQIGKTPVKNLIIEIVQDKKLNETTSPNPIFEEQVILTKALLVEKFGEIPVSLQMKLKDPKTKVYGIGAVHNGNISVSSKKMTYTQEIVNTLLAERINLPDSAFAVDSPEFWVSDLIFVSAVMFHLNIPSVINIKAYDDPKVATSGSTIGIIVWPDYWKTK